MVFPDVTPMKNNCSQKVFSLGHIYFSRNKHFPVKFWYTHLMGKVNLTKREKFLTSNLYHKRRNEPVYA